MNADKPAVAVDGLCKTFETVTAVDKISFSVSRGATVALLGGNGAGKTTTLSMLLGLITPSAGRIEILGHDMSVDAPAIRAKMNFESPYVDLPRRLSVRQNLEIYAQLYGVTDRTGAIERLAHALDLNGLLDRGYGTLSAGQKTRASLAKALINSPEILLLDEPTASLDPDSADWVRTMLEAYQKENNASILLASHNMPEVERLADHVIMLRTGRIEDEGTPAALIDRYGRSSLEEVFLDVARGSGWDKEPESHQASENNVRAS